MTDARIVLEPVGRNSAPAIAAAAILVAEEDPDAVLWMMAADAAIADTCRRCIGAAAAAAAAARAGRIVTFGMRPTAPETGYGYIETGAALDDAPACMAVARFIEKPDAATAACLAGGAASLELGHVRRSPPDPARRVGDACAGLLHAGAAGSGGAAARPRLHPPRRRGVHRKPLDQPRLRGRRTTSRAAVVPADIGWSDVGSWGALWESAAQGCRRQRRSGRRAAGGARRTATCAATACWPP